MVAFWAIIRLEVDLDTAQRVRLADFAERTPVTLTLKHGDHDDLGLDGSPAQSLACSATL
jgi:hypothetical protein